MTESLPEDERLRQFSALNAISTIYPKEIGEILNTNLSNIIINKVNDANWDKVITYLGTVTAWESLSEPCEIKAKAFIDKIDLLDSSSTSSKRFSHQVVNTLVKACHVSFLRQSIINKLQKTPVKDLLSIKKLQEDKIFNKIVINNLLKEAIPQATINELILMSLEADTSLKKLVEPRLIEQIKESSIVKLVSIIYRYQDECLTQLIEHFLIGKVQSAALDELVEARDKYQMLDVTNEELIKLFDERVSELIKDLPFDEIIEQSEYWDLFNEYSFKAILKNNIPAIINKFVNSHSYLNASSNTELIIRIAEYLSPLEWETILEAFCKNDQIHDSHRCLEKFCLLFKNSVEASVIIQPYWLSFRESLNNFNYKRFDNLKSFIDSYKEVEF